MCAYIYIYIYIYSHVCIYIYIRVIHKVIRLSPEKKAIADHSCYGNTLPLFIKWEKLIQISVLMQPTQWWAVDYQIKNLDVAQNFLNNFHTYTHTHIYIYIYIYTWRLLKISQSAKERNDFVPYYIYIYTHAHVHIILHIKSTVQDTSFLKLLSTL